MSHWAPKLSERWGHTSGLSNAQRGLGTPKQGVFALISASVVPPSLLVPHDEWSCSCNGGRAFMVDTPPPVTVDPPAKDHIRDPVEFWSPP